MPASWPGWSITPASPVRQLRLRPHLTEFGIDVSTGTVDDALDKGGFSHSAYNGFCGVVLGGCRVLGGQTIGLSGAAAGISYSRSPCR
jgi:hypothetical protein